MGMRFHRSFQVLPGVRVNLSKTGVSLSVGGAPVTINFRKGHSRVTGSVPGTGMSYTKDVDRETFGRGSVWQRMWDWLFGAARPPR